MATTTPYPFIRTSSGAGATETTYLSVGPMRITARLANGDVFI